MSISDIGLFYNQAGVQVSQNEVDNYWDTIVDNPSVSTTWIGTAAGGTSTQAKALVLISQYMDYPRNALYSVVGTNTMGGTWAVNGVDQFGYKQTETVTIGTAGAGTPSGSVFGTVIWSQITSGTFTVATAAVGAGSAQIGVGTLSNGSAQSNWFGCGVKLGGTADLRQFTWISSTTVTAINAGTSFGTLLGFNANGSLPSNAFQGTSGVATTDHYRLAFKSSFDARDKGTQCA